MSRRCVRSTPRTTSRFCGGATGGGEATTQYRLGAVRLGVIDIGTNTLLLLVAERCADGQVRAVCDVCRFGRLGQGLDASKQLHPDAIARSLVICREYRALLDHHRVEKVRVIATQAMREAENASEFVGPASSILDANVETIDGPREAEL